MTETKIIFKNLTTTAFTISNADTITLTGFTLTMPLSELDMGPQYAAGTKLLRDAAKRAERYNYKKANSRSGWKTRKELRNV